MILIIISLYKGYFSTINFTNIALRSNVKLHTVSICLLG
jgi:hypothetical protein